MSDFTIDYATNQYSGAIFKKTINLLNGDGAHNYSIRALGFTKASVQIRSNVATGTSGDVIVKEQLAQGELGRDLATLTVGDNTNDSVYGLDVVGGYLELDVSGLVTGEEGTISIIVTLKK